IKYSVYRITKIVSYINKILETLTVSLFYKDINNDFIYKLSCSGSDNLDIFIKIIIFIIG
ncbi:hypothetical protein DPZ13_09430, partial [Klebsiella pneumoniae]